MRVYPYCLGAQYYPWAPEFVRDPASKAELTGLLKRWVNRRQYVTPYWLTSDQIPMTLGASATADFSVKIGDDGHFESFGHCAVSTGDFAIEISEVKTRQTIMNGVINQVAGIGDARFPTIYPVPYLMPAGYRLNLRITNLTAAPNNIYWTFFGRKIYAPFTQAMEVLHDTAVPTPADTPTQFVPRPLIGD